MTPTAKLRRACLRDAHRFGGYSNWLMFRCLPTLVAAGLALLVLASSPARSQAGATNSGPERAGGAPADVVAGMALGEIEGARLLLQSAGARSYRPALLQDSRVHFDITGMVAKVHLVQRFRNDSEHFVEGVYAFPLPDDAAVRAMEMRVGERRIVGAIREKDAAKKIYQAAKAAGKKAGLVEQQRPNLFTNRIANIAPGQTVEVSLEYVQPVAYAHGRFGLRFPMTITPRYMPGNTRQQARTPRLETEENLLLDTYLGWAQPTDQVPDAAAISPLLHPAPGSDTAPINPIEITAVLDPGMPLSAVTSDYHNIALSRSAGVYNIELARGVSEMDRDFVLHWAPAMDAAPRAALFTEKVGADYYGLLMVVPPTQAVAGEPLPREVVFVVDTSGSMGGVPIAQARASLERALQQLRATDRFNIIAFNSSYHSLYRTAMPATRKHLRRAQQFVRQLQASGGTEMLPALRAALEPAQPAEMQREVRSLRQVVFITDGAVGNEEALFRDIAGRLGTTRLFTVGIGSAPNSWFMRKAANFGRGTHTHIGDLREVGVKMAELFAQLSRPVAVDLKVQWPTAVEAWPQRVPDLYHGQPLSVAVNFGSQIPTGEVTVSGRIHGAPWRQRLQINGTVEGGRHAGVASLWARRKIAVLMDQIVAGREEAAVREEVLPLALQHQLISRYTSFVAVEEVIARPDNATLRSQAVANTRPRGQSPQSFAYPNTATTGPAKLWFTALALFLALILRVVRTEEVDRATPDLR